MTGGRGRVEEMRLFTFWSGFDSRETSQPCRGFPGNIISANAVLGNEKLVLLICVIADFFFLHSLTK